MEVAQNNSLACLWLFLTVSVVKQGLSCNQLLLLVLLLLLLIVEPADFFHVALCITIQYNRKCQCHFTVSYGKEAENRWV